MLKQNVPVEDIKEDPEWFTDEELHSYKIADNMLSYMEGEGWFRN